MNKRTIIIFVAIIGFLGALHFTAINDNQSQDARPFREKELIINILNSPVNDLIIQISKEYSIKYDIKTIVNILDGSDFFFQLKNPQNTQSNPFIWLSYDQANTNQPAPQMFVNPQIRLFATHTSYSKNAIDIGNVNNLCVLEKIISINGLSYMARSNEDIGAIRQIYQSECDNCTTKLNHQIVYDEPENLYLYQNFVFITTKSSKEDHQLSHNCHIVEQIRYCTHGIHSFGHTNLLSLFNFINRNELMIVIDGHKYKDKPIQRAIQEFYSYCLSQDHFLHQINPQEADIMLTIGKPVKTISNVFISNTEAIVNLFCNESIENKPTCLHYIEHLKLEMETRNEKLSTP